VRAAVGQPADAISLWAESVIGLDRNTQVQQRAPAQLAGLHDAGWVRSTLRSSNRTRRGL